MLQGSTKKVFDNRKATDLGEKERKRKKRRTQHETDVRFRQNNRGDYPNAKC